MRRLWNYIPPCMSDILGFESVINQTGGMGIVDDCTRYRPLGVGRIKSSGSWLTWPDINDESFDWDIDWDDNGAEPKDQTDRPLSRGIRLAASNIRTVDIIHGTSAKVRGAYDRHSPDLKPDFLLLCHAPSSTMISSDLDLEAEYLERKYNVPTACVPIDGSKDYLYGIGQTLLSMGKLLLSPKEKIPGSINILGCNKIDWAESSMTKFEEILASLGIKIISRWGMKESSENLKMAACASVNWVVNSSGMPLARYMYSEFGIPYIMGAPFGDKYTDSLFELLHSADSQSAGTISLPKIIGLPSRANVLIIAEQFLGEAMRRILLSRGAKGCIVASFNEMDKDFCQVGDVHLTCEDDLKKLVSEGHFTAIAGDPDLRLAAGSDARWINLPNGGSYSPANLIDPVNMIGQELDLWLNVEMARAGFQPKNVRFKLL